MRTLGYLVTGLVVLFGVALLGHAYGYVWRYFWGGTGDWDRGYFVGVTGVLAVQCLYRKWARTGAVEA